MLRENCTMQYINEIVWNCLDCMKSVHTRTSIIDYIVNRK